MMNGVDPPLVYGQPFTLASGTNYLAYAQEI